MTGLFTAERISIFTHSFQNISITYSCNHTAAAHFLQRLVKTNIAHNSAHNSILFQTAFFFQFQSAQQHNLIAVHFLPFFVNSQTAVRITIISNADICAILQNSRFQALYMG